MTTEIAPGVFAIPADFDGVPLTVYALMGDRPALIDTGVATTPDEHLAPALASLGSGLAEVGWIVNTHAHHDHVGGNAAVRAASPDVRIAVHAVDAEWAQSPERYFAGLYRAGPWDPDPTFERRVRRLFGPGAAVDVRLSDGDEIDLAPDRRLRVRWTPAHSPGHVVLHDGDIVFAGDAIQRYGTEIEERGWLFPFYTDVDVYRRSLRAIGGMACTAHFGPVTGSELQRLVADSEELVETLDDLIAGLLRERGAITLPEIADVLLDRWPHYQRGVQLYATPRAHLDALVEAGRARAVEQRWEAL